jgi:uncharacterized Zn-binding protein involved in type VI secretion
MAGIARLGDPITGGVHCHGHPHAPPASPGTIVEGATKVFVEGRPAARSGDRGYSPACCGGVGEIVCLQSQAKVFVEGQPAASAGTPTLHCGMGPGQVQLGSLKVHVP